MIGRVATRYAIRGMFRHLRRTILSVVGVGVGVAIGLAFTSLMGGSAEMQIRLASESGAGHVKVVPESWPDTREDSLRLNRWREAMETVRSLPGLRAAAPRARTSGLLAFGNRTAGVELTGVDPEAEQASNRLVAESDIEGRYLREGDADVTVVGQALAERLDVELDDDLMVTLSGKDGIRAAMLRIVGLLSTGSRDLDASFCHVTLAEHARLTGRQGAGEIAVLLDDHGRIDEARATLSERVPTGNVVVTWEVVNPGIAANLRGDTAFMRSIVFLVVVMVALGIASAQLAVVLERRREFGVLMALGMKGRQVVGLLAIEAVLTGVAGAAVGLAIGGTLAWHMATRGIDFSRFMGDEMTIENVLFEPVMYGSFGLWIVGYALAVSLAATLAATAYPAWFAVRTDPAEAIRTV
jgi:ABC-type lipoprotein release transport system permease subunit